MKNNQIKFAVPSTWEIKDLKTWLNYQNGIKNSSIISEVYGCLPNSVLPHGRTSSSVRNTDTEEIYNYRNKLRQLKINFAYLINGPIEKERLNNDEVIDYIEWVLNKLKPDSITATSLDLMKIIRKIDQNIDINVSTIAGVKNLSDIKKFLTIKPKKIILHHDANRNFSELKRIIKFCKNNNIFLELLATESCLRRCPTREQHYQHISKKIDDEKFHINCNKIKISKPYNLLMANFIRPEDLVFYKNLGINYFKITGRSKSTTWLDRVIKAYLDNSYEGNLMDLLDIALPYFEDASKEIKISNKALDGFIEKYPEKDKEKEILYCKEWLEKLKKEKFFNVSDKVIERLLIK